MYNDDSETALLEEMALYDIAEEPENDGEEWHGIDIKTDARHGWRKNAKDTSVVCIGDRSHKVLRHEYITKEDDHVTQRHEKIGTERIYDYFDQNEVPIRIHTHDRNMSINKMVKVQHKEDGVLNQNDKWHALKNLKKGLNAISSGPKYKSGITWHTELEDKVEPIVQHASWAIDNCDKDPLKLKACWT